MLDLFGNHIVGFPTRWLIYVTNRKINILRCPRQNAVVLRLEFLYGLNAGLSNKRQLSNIKISCYSASGKSKL